MNMKIKTIPLAVLLTLGLFLFAGPVSATIKDIPSGGTVFIGEQGLDISGPAGVGAAQLGWWASGADITTTSPDNTISVQDTSNFYVDPSRFGSNTGSWYLLPAKTPVFTVADPQLAIRVEDTSVSVDVTDRWVPTGDEIQFRIDNNLVPILQRGVASVPITIRVQDPVGGEYTSLLNTAGTATSLVIPVTSARFYTGSIWDTGQRASYPPGTYTIWAECNVNSMKDNYNVAGKTVSQTVSLLDQDKNPLIQGNYPTTTTTTALPATTTQKITQAPTSVPKTTLLTTVQTPVPVTTNPVMISPSVTQPPTATPSPIPTKSPGFEGILTCFAIVTVLMLFPRSD